MGQFSTSGQEAVSFLFQEVFKQDQKLEEPPGPLSPLLKEPLTKHPLSKEPQKPPLLLPGDHHCGCVALAPPPTSLASSVTQAWASSGGVFLPFSALSTTQGLHLCSTSIKQKHEKFQTN